MYVYVCNSRTKKLHLTWPAHRGFAKGLHGGQMPCYHVPPVCRRPCSDLSSVQVLIHMLTAQTHRAPEHQRNSCQSRLTAHNTRRRNTDRPPTDRPIVEAENNCFTPADTAPERTLNATKRPPTRRPNTRTDLAVVSVQYTRRALWTTMHDILSNTTTRRQGAWSDTAVCLSVCLSNGAAALGYRYAGCLQFSHVRTADPSADGRRSAASRTAIGRGFIVLQPRVIPC